MREQFPLSLPHPDDIPPGGCHSENWVLDDVKIIYRALCDNEFTQKLIDLKNYYGNICELTVKYKTEKQVGETVYTLLNQLIKMRKANENNELGTDIYNSAKEIITHGIQILQQK